MMNTAKLNSVISDLNEARTMRQEASSRELQAVAAAKKAGVSWAIIGRCLGMSKQAAHKRFADQLEELDQDSEEPAPAAEPLFLEPTPPAAAENPIHHGITDTAGRPIRWNKTLGKLTPSTCPYCQKVTHFNEAEGQWLIFPSCEITSADRKSTHAPHNIAK